MQDSQQSRDVRRRMPWSAWLLLPVIVLLGVSLKVSWDIETKRAETQYQSDVRKAEKRYQDLTKNILTNQLYHQKATPEDIEKVLGTKQSLQLQTDGPNYVAHWTDPVSHSPFRIKFDSNKHYTGRSAGFSPSQVPRPTPRWDAIQQSTRKLGRMLCPTLGGIFTPLPYLLWLPLLLTYFIASNCRGIVSYALACVAVVFPLIWVMASFSVLRLDSIFSYDPSGWGLVMFLVTAVAIGLGGVRDRITDPLACKQCGYNLKGNTTGRCPECGIKHDLLYGKTGA